MAPTTTPLPPRCGRRFTLTRYYTRITSPGYDMDKHYGHNQQCTWVIKVPANRILMFRFKGDFSIFTYPGSGKCIDWVEVRTMENTRGNNVDRVCGYKRPRGLWRSKKGLVITFKASSTVPWIPLRRGFQASIYAYRRS
ncbi:hypothetical protein NP493_122g07042 [Ridgeia piscesae]|uniref:CUB domain-containing protein n=1 Tax=Ridgeia piscesae TaxID=27915 RepID=A0AAD9P641_RIDPI|nr:hypothetical protein NP493_122g07042 [Ridgeia piscesae]